MDLLKWIDHAAFALGVAGMSVILWGSLTALTGFVRGEVGRLRGFDPSARMDRLRLGFGAYLLLGLEFMVAADIIHTIAKPDNQGLIVLASIVVIRTVISFFLTREIKAAGKGNE